ncbi:hypothetical protein SAMN04515667_2217 [Formosa sp. Hel1_31_208]|uniref:hypothetical protein n=1 Tax=Formosa sp. Hel1_31_208 TaxID=1798225 RepID=UPI00087D2A9A|nr:hypothetical protein [Formosa sp. Hel1_31_208]SDS45474.1 hypothetical protein SAMN04515667_2217 [Formosa sp. Hel1_31_208]
MKKLVLLFTGLLMGLTTVATAETMTASQGTDFDNSRYRFAEPIVFIERGVEFLIFPDGSFDFNTDLYNNVSNVYYRSPRTRRGSVNTTYGAPGTTTRSHYTNNGIRGVIITHNSNGQVRRIGNVFINYDRQGRIKRAGTVYMSYQRRNGVLRQVGGLRVNYNRWGEIIHISGIVNQNNAQLNCGVGSGLGGYEYNDLGDYGDFDEDYYYYRKNGKVKKQKKRQFKS